MPIGTRLAPFWISPNRWPNSYHIEPPSSNGFIRHVDRITGVPAWWKPFDVDWTFAYPSKVKE